MRRGTSSVQTTQAEPWEPGREAATPQSQEGPAGASWLPEPCLPSGRGTLSSLPETGTDGSLKAGLPGQT